MCIGSDIGWQGWASKISTEGRGTELEHKVLVFLIDVFTWIWQQNLAENTENLYMLFYTCLAIAMPGENHSKNGKPTLRKSYRYNTISIIIEWLSNLCAALIPFVSRIWFIWTYYEQQSHNRGSKGDNKMDPKVFKKTKPELFSYNEVVSPNGCERGQQRKKGFCRLRNTGCLIGTQHCLLQQPAGKKWKTCRRV